MFPEEILIMKSGFIFIKLSARFGKQSRRITSQHNISLLNSNCNSSISFDSRVFAVLSISYKASAVLQNSSSIFAIFQLQTLQSTKNFILEIKREDSYLANTSQCSIIRYRIQSTSLFKDSLQTVQTPWSITGREFPSPSR